MGIVECIKYCKKILFKKLEVITHKNNIGANANIIRAIEISEANYTWILCDDDTLQLDYLGDVIEILEEEKIDLIHVGAHKNNLWADYAGQITGVRDAYEKGYHYFRFSSFLPCNIFKTSLFQNEFLIDAYNNITNGYPHMPFLLEQYKKNSLFYVSQKQLVVASETGQSYSHTQFCFWWLKTCLLLVDKKDVRNAFIDQWSSAKEPMKASLNFIFETYKNINDRSSKFELTRFVNRYYERSDAYKFNIEKKIYELTHNSYFRILKKNKF